VKIFEALFLLGAGVLFAWWQLRDVRIAREKAAKERERKAADDAARPTGDAP
jgi:hypothetical protein